MSRIRDLSKVAVKATRDATFLTMDVLSDQTTVAATCFDETVSVVD